MTPYVNSAETPPINWHENKPLAETNLHMLEEEILCDVTFLAGENKIPLKAHKFMLVSRSPVFYAMLCGPLAESKDSITVPDIEPQVFKALFRYMYTENCGLSGENVTALLYAAKKYGITGLTQRCRDFLHENTMTDNVCTILQHAVQLDEDKLVEKSLEYIYTNGEEVLQSESFKSLGKGALKYVVESDKLQAKEELIYKVCVEWGKHQCELVNKDKSDANIRECLGELLFFIRFPAMSVEAFTATVSRDAVLTADEKVSVFQGFVDKSIYHDKFPTKPRRTKRESYVINRFDKGSSGWGHRGSVDAITFSCSEDVLLMGISLFTPCESGSVNGTVEIAGDTGTIIFKKTVELEYDSSKQFEDMSLESPLHLQKDTYYTLSQVFQGKHTNHGEDGIATIADKNITVRFFETTQSKNGTNVNRGQFKRLLLQGWSIC